MGKNKITNHKSSNNYDTLIIYSIPFSFKMNHPIIKLKAKNNIWTVSKYKIINNQLYGDTLVKDCVNCPKIFDEIIKLDLLNLPNETALIKQCIDYKDTVLNGEKVTRITSLEGIEDISLHRIEYKIGNKSRTLVYRDPVEALTICPDSEERIKFLKIIRLMEGL